MNALYCALFVLMAVATVHSSPTPDDDAEVGVEKQDSSVGSENCNKKSYVFLKVAMNWANAQAACLANSLPFATILNQAEQNKFVSDRVAQGVTTGQLWVAGYDNGNNNDFKWVPQQTPFHYINWASGYPRIILGTYNQCVYLADDSTWYNGDCSSDRYYACHQCD